jgi:hypothetical protein
MFVIVSASAVVFVLLMLLSYFIAGVISDKKAQNSGFGSGSMEVSAEEGGIDGNTVIQFVYHYADGITEVYNSVPAKYMSGWGRERIAKAYGKWIMDYYSPEKVVFHKNVDKDSSQHYILKEYNGYVAVFYSEDKRIKEITSANMLSLDAKEREKYAQGVEIVGNKELMRVLQDLES